MKSHFLWGHYAPTRSAKLFPVWELMWLSVSCMARANRTSSLRWCQPSSQSWGRETEVKHHGRRQRGNRLMYPWWCEDVLFTVNSSTGLYTFNPFKLKVWWSGDEQQPVCCWKTSMNELIINYRVAAVIWGVVLLTCRSGERPEAAMYELPMVFIFSTSWKKHSSSSCTDTQEWFSYWL